MKRLWTYINLLSIDIAVSAALVSFVITSSLLPAVQVSPWAFILLGSTTWLIFTFDHLADAQKIAYPASSKRHRFHQENFYVLLMAFLFVFFATAAIFFFLELYALVIPALVVVSICGLYFLNYYLLKKYRRIFYGKETLISLGFAGGCLVIPFSVVTEQKEIWPLVFSGLYLFAIAWQNLLLLGVFEKPDHRNERDYSMTWWVSWKTRKNLFLVCGCAALAAGITCLMTTGHTVWISLYVSIPLWYFTLWIFRGRFRSVEMIRMLTDGAFLLAGIDAVRLILAAF